MKRALAGLALVLASCATTSQTRGRPQAYAEPEPDPACRGNLAQCRALTGIEQVVVKVGVSAEGKVAFVDVLTPDVTAADTIEIRRALEGCVWKPALGPNGEPLERSFTLAIHR